MYKRVLSMRKALFIVLAVLAATSLLNSRVYAACGGLGTGGGGGTAGAVAGNGGDGTAGTLGGCASGGGGGGGSGGSGASGAGGTGAGGGLVLKTTSGTVAISGSIDARGGNNSTTNGGSVKIFNTGGCTSTSTVSAGRIYTSGGSGVAANGNCIPTAPSLVYPVSSSSGNSVFTTFKLRSGDTEGDYLNYWIDVCADNTCTSVIRSVCQVNSGTGVPGTCTSSQNGWASQDMQTGTAYSSNPTLTLSTLATLNYQPPLLTANTQYWWRGYAIDPGGSNTWSGASTINGFTTAPTETHIQGNVRIQGNVKL
jgi:hypothetical protein